MGTQHNKNSIQKLISLAGVASASVFLSLPALSLTPPTSSLSNQPLNNQSDLADSTVRTRELLAQGMSENSDSTTPECVGYLGNLTSGGGYYCGLYKLNQPSTNREASTMNRSSTTGAGYPGNGVSPNSGSNTMERPSTTGGSSSMDQPSTTGAGDTMNRPSTTGAGYPGNGVSPNPGSNTMDKQSSTTGGSSEVAQESTSGVNTMEQQSTTSETTTINRESTTTQASPMNRPSTTGAGYPGNGVSPNTEAAQGVRGLW
jgi:hypothetical protein